MPSYKLYYWNAKGRGEPIRLMFAQVGVKYEDVRYERKEWPGNLKAGTLPSVVLTIDSHPL